MGKISPQEDLRVDLEIEYATLLDAKAQEVSRKKFGAFVSYTYPGYLDAPFNIKLRKALDAFVEGKIQKLAIFTPPQHGKGVNHTKPILTTKGWTVHGKLEAGDFVFHPNGKPVQVVAESPEFMCNRRVHLTNNEIIDTHENHEWTVINRAKTRNKNYINETLETKQIEQSDYWYKDGGKFRCRFLLPEKKPVEFPTNNNLPITPYLLGLWLGDGQSSGFTLNLNKDDSAPIHEKLVSLDIGHTITIRKEQPTTQNIGILNSIHILRDHNLLQNKHIPKEYITSSIAQRLELIAGLMDSDGYYYSKTGRYCLSNTNKDIIQTCARILESLSIRTTIAEFEPRLSSGGIQGRQVVYQLTFNTDLNIPCALARKRNSNPLKVKRKVGIKKIEVIENGEMGKCIQVDSEDGLYLVGESLIPTHNSELVSRKLAPYILGRFPDKRVVGASYSGDFAKRFSRDAKRLINSEPYRKLFPETTVNNSRKRDVDEVSSANLYEIVGRKGYHQTVGIGGQLTGVPVDVGIIDDPIKDSEEANSEVMRQKVWDWYETVFCTRLHNDSQQLLTMTRWHEDDLAGRILAQEGDEWVVIKLPALYEEKGAWDQDDREVDEPLWPEKHSFDRMNKIRERSPRTFTSLYQQRPAPDSGIIIDIADFQYYTPDTLPTNFDEIIQSWDCAFKGDSKSDYVVGQLWGRKKRLYYLIDQKRARLTFGKTMLAIADMTIKHPKAKRKLVEDKANGPAIISMMKIQITGIIPFDPGIKDKTSRARSISHCVDSHNVYLPHESYSPWIKGFVEEWRMFPNGANDDQVDASVQAIYTFEETPTLIITDIGSVTKESRFKSSNV